MAIIFKNIDTGETVGVDRETGGKFYRAKLSALMNSSNLSPNADRGQDFGWRLKEEQQAILQMWESDPEMIDRISAWAKTPVDNLTHSEFLSYMLYQEELGKSPEQTQDAERRQNQSEYDRRVAKLMAEAQPKAVPAFDASKVKRGEATIDDFLSGDLTGDDGGDKVVEDLEVEDVHEDGSVEATVEGEKQTLIPADDATKRAVNAVSKKSTKK